MFIVLSKILPILVYPLGIVFILLLSTLTLFRWPRWQRVILISTILLLWLSSNRWTALSLARSLEWRYLPPAQVPEAEVIVVLGGGTESALFPRNTIEVNSAGDRVLYAAWLYRQGKAGHILLSGGRIDWLSSGPPPAQDMADLIAWMGVPKEAIWLDTSSRNTYENAVNTRRILEDEGIGQVLLVTSALHMPRSVGLFVRQGIDVIPVPTDFKVTQESWNQLTEVSFPSLILNLLPGADNLASVTQSLKEYLGIFVYWLRGWI